MATARPDGDVSGNDVTDSAGPDGDASDAPPARGRRWRYPALFALIALGLAAAVTVGVLVPKVLAAGDQEERRLRAVDTAKQLAVNLLTVRHDRIEENTKSVESLISGEFRQQYMAGEPLLKTVAKQRKTVSEPTVREAGVVEMDGDSATVLVAADANRTNQGDKEPELLTPRFQMTLRLVKDQWRVVQLRYV